MREVWECVLREFHRRRGRFFANTLGFFLAVALFVSLIHLLRMSQAAEAALIARTGTNFMGFVPARVASGAFTIERRTLGDDPNSDFLINTVLSTPFPISKTEEVRALPMVLDASPFLMFRARNPEKGHYFTIGGFKEGNLLAVGETCCAPCDVVAGEYLSSANGRDGVLVEQNYAQSWQIEVGNRVRIAGEEFVVRGIVNSGTHPAKADLYLLFANAERVINRFLNVPLASEANAILVRIDLAKNQDEAMRRVKALMAGGVITSYSCFRPAATVAGISDKALLLLTLVAVAGAILLSLKSQLSNVLERRRDIAILKAIGWRSGNVVRQILLESVVQALIGGLAGGAAGLALYLALPLSLLPGGGSIPREISVVVCLSGILAALLGGLLAGAIPAWVAARQSPATALRRG